jgi:hypothetical protein
MVGYDTRFFPGSGALVFSFIIGVTLIAAWVILAGSRFVQGGIVERSERVPQLYGYTVCLIALIWALTSVVAIVENTLSLSAPELRGVSEFGFEPSVSSFEAFRTTYDRARQIMTPNPSAAKLDSLPEPELRRRYEALRADRIVRVQFEARRELIVKTLSLLLASALFAFHWRWLKRSTAARAIPVGG